MQRSAGALTDSVPLNAAGEGVALIAMPFLPLDIPSLALGLLKAVLHQWDIPCDDYPFYLDFIREGGVPDLQALGDHAFDLAGEYAFAGELGFEGSVDEEQFSLNAAQRRGVRTGDVSEFAAMLRRVRRQAVPAFLSRVVKSHRWGRYGLIGLSSTFQQQAASLALARRLKRQFPHVPIVLGGANVFGDMGRAWLEFAPYLDYVCIGEGDTALPMLFKALAAGRPADSIPNIIARRGGEIVAGAEQPAAVPLDSLPIPDHTTHFRVARELDVPPSAITFEASRGCWWGAKHHCVFCGLNSNAMAYRSKSPGRLHAEIRQLSQRHRVTAFNAADNILDRSYVPTFLRQLDEEGSDLTFFFEVKSNMRLSEIRDLRRAGVTAVQPGIESLSTPILRLMRKGVTGLQNVFFLKWARYFGMSADWNVLCGFFGEQPEHYAAQSAWMRLLSHLQPPRARVPIVLERFSPMFHRPEEFGIRNVRAGAPYRDVYIDPRLSLERIAYYFDHDGAGRLPPESFRETDEVLATWRQADARGAALVYERSPGGFLRIRDTRACEQCSSHVLRSPDDEVFVLAGEGMDSPALLARKVRHRSGFEVSEKHVRNVLDELVEAGLAVREAERYLTLALPVSRRYFDRPFHGEFSAESAGVSLPVLSVATGHH